MEARRSAGIEMNWWKLLIKKNKSRDNISVWVEDMGGSDINNGMVSPS